MTTYTKSKTSGSPNIKPNWHVIDAEGQTLGRLATQVATLLQGKHKPIYVSHLNTGDFVVIINAEKIHVTGKKIEQKMYYRHSGYHGGLTERTLGQLLKKTPTRAIQHAVKGMLPKNSLGRKMLGRLKLYAGTEHPHEAQVREGLKKVKISSDKRHVKDTKTPGRSSTKTSAIKSKPAGSRTNATENIVKEKPPKKADPAVGEMTEQPKTKDKQITTFEKPKTKKTTTKAKDKRSSTKATNTEGK